MSISNLQLTNKLQNQFTEQHLHRPWRTTRYDDGAQLEYEITSIINSQKANIKIASRKICRWWICRSGL